MVVRGIILVALGTLFQTASLVKSYPRLQCDVMVGEICGKISLRSNSKIG